MNCCDYQCNQGRNCPARSARATPHLVDTCSVPAEAGNFYAELFGDSHKQPLYEPLTTAERWLVLGVAIGLIFIWVAALGIAAGYTWGTFADDVTAYLTGVL